MSVSVKGNLGIYDGEAAVVVVVATTSPPGSILSLYLSFLGFSKILAHVRTNGVE